MTNMTKYLTIFTSFFLSVFFFGSFAYAIQSDTTYEFSLTNSPKKIIKSFDNGALTFSFLPRGIKGSATLHVQKKSKDSLDTHEQVDEYLEHISQIYYFSVEKNSALQRPITISFSKKAIASDKGIFVYYYDPVVLQWKKITTIRGKSSLTTSLFSSKGMIALFRERGWVDGQTVIPSYLPARSVYVVDKDATVLLAKNQDKKLSLASITKLMTALVFLDHNPGWDTSVTVTKSDDTLPAKVPYFQGATVTTKDLFYCMLVGSRNNCATALARSTGLTQKKFIEQMNAKAYDLGLIHTVFADVSGLDPKNISTAKEFAFITHAAFENEHVRHALSVSNYTIKFLNDKKRMYGMKNTNLLLREPMKNTAMIGKTGFIDEAGFTFATQARQDGKEITVIVLGAPDSDTRFRISKMLIEKGLHGTLAKKRPSVAQKK